MSDPLAPVADPIATLLAPVEPVPPSERGEDEGFGDDDDEDDDDTDDDDDNPDDDEDDEEVDEGDDEGTMQAQRS